MADVFEWKEDFVTGNDEVDNEHRQLFAKINKLYEMFLDTNKYHKEIPELTEQLKSIMLEHFEIENELLEKYNIESYEEHIKIHNEIKESICEIDKYNLPVIIAALLLSDIIINYFLKHFPEYDKKFIAELNEKQKLDS